MKGSLFLSAITALSIAAIPFPVKAQSSASQRPDSDLKDSVKSDQNDFSKLIQTLMKSGNDWEYPNGFAQVVGLDGPMPAKVTLEVVGGKGYKCHVVYANDAGANRPLCVYLVRAKKTKHDLEERYFRVSLDGKLEKAVILRNKLDDDGKAIREGRSKTDEDIESADVQKDFKADMNFWVKNWLRKQQKKGKAEASDPAASGH